MEAADKLVNYISKISRKTYKKSFDTKIFKNIGSFGSIFDLSSLKMSHPLIVSSTDGVGTKIEIANQIKKTVVGKGHASKEQVSFMVQQLLKLNKAPQADAADALAGAICHAYHSL